MTAVRMTPFDSSFDCDSIMRLALNAFTIGHQGKTVCNCRSIGVMEASVYG